MSISIKRVAHKPAAAATVNAAKPTARRSTVQSAGTGLAVLKMLATMGGAASLTALAARLEESPAKVHRYLASLIEAGFVQQEPETARYLLGVEAIAIGLAAMRQSDVLTLAAQQLARLADEHALSCFVAVGGNRGPTIVRWFEPVQPVTVNVKVGSVMPVLWSATGRIYGAYANSAEVDALIGAELAAASPAQRRLLPNRRAVDALFDEVRSLGCAPLRDVLLDGVSAVAVPILGTDGRLAAVLTALGISGRFDPSPDGATARLLRGAADAVGARLGGRAAG